MLEKNTNSLIFHTYFPVKNLDSRDKNSILLGFLLILLILPYYKFFKHFTSILALGSVSNC